MKLGCLILEERNNSMPNFAQTFKAEIVRISRKEINVSVNLIHKSNVSLKKSVAELKRKIAALESEIKRLKSFYKKIEEQKPEVPPEIAEKVRFTSKTIQKIRNKLGLTQEQFAKLLKVSSQNIHAMEHKVGRLKFRSATLAKLLSIRGLGKREARKRLKEIGNKK
jgi:DNA-binding transcriptional regulator YiaG